MTAGNNHPHAPGSTRGLAIGSTTNERGPGLRRGVVGCGERLACATLLAVMFVSQATAQTMYQGIGGNTCAELLSARAEGNLSVDKQISDWTLGFFTGMNAALSGAESAFVDLSSLESEATVVALIVDGCQARKSERVFFVALDAYEALGSKSLTPVSNSP